MKKFKNVKTGNIVRPKNAEAEALMEKSAQYIVVAEAKKPKSKDSDDKN